MTIDVSCHPTICQYKIQKINEYLEQCLEFRKKKLFQEYQDVGFKIFYERMENDICFRIWSGEISIWKIKSEILQNRRGFYRAKKNPHSEGQLED